MSDDSAPAAGVTYASASRGVLRNGPPDAVRISFETWLAIARPQALVRAIVFAVDRQQLGAVFAGPRPSPAARRKPGLLYSPDRPACPGTTAS